MKFTVLGVALGMALVGGVSVSNLFAAEETAKTLPTLLIKGEVVSLDSTDPAATLLKVKDRYGFETPIYLTPETKITQGDAAVQVASLAAGTSVQVEYNFDVNTAKRHAVSVKVATPAAPTAAQPSTTPPSATAPAAPAATSPESASPTMSTPAATAPPASAPAPATSPASSSTSPSSSAAPESTPAKQ